MSWSNKETRLQVIKACRGTRPLRTALHFLADFSDRRASSRVSIGGNACFIPESADIG